MAQHVFAICVSPILRSNPACIINCTWYQLIFLHPTLRMFFFFISYAFTTYLCNIPCLQNVIFKFYCYSDFKEKCELCENVDFSTALYYQHYLAELCQCYYFTQMYLIRTPKTFRNTPQMAD